MMISAVEELSRTVGLSSSEAAKRESDSDENVSAEEEFEIRRERGLKAGFLRRDDDDDEVLLRLEDRRGGSAATGFPWPEFAVIATVIGESEGFLLLVRLWRWCWLM